jgi:hypothetical protein
MKVTFNIQVTPTHSYILEKEFARPVTLQEAIENVSLEVPIKSTITVISWKDI